MPMYSKKISLLTIGRKFSLTIIFTLPTVPLALGNRANEQRRQNIHKWKEKKKKNLKILRHIDKIYYNNSQCIHQITLMGVILLKSNDKK